MRFFRRFDVQIVLRVVLLAVFLLAFSYAAFRWPVTAAPAIGSLVVYEIYSLVSYARRSSKAVTRFLEAVRYGDFSQSFAANQTGFEDLERSMAEIMTEFQKSRAATEEQYHYLQTIIQHVGVGLLSFKPDGRVDLINSAAKRLLRVSNLRNIQALSDSNPIFVKKVAELKPGEKTLVKLTDRDDMLQLSMSATELRIRGEQLMLVSLQDIHGELEEKEAEAWQSLTRVLTHEIMNSMTPISSLAATVSDMIETRRSGGASPDPDASETNEDIRSAVQTIRKRSEGLMRFVQAYRSLTLIPRPRFKIVPVAELFNRTETLLSSKLREANISFASRVDPGTLELTADPELMEQVLINLMLNAIEAVSGKPEARIELLASMNDRGRPLITLTDNGPGIVAEAIEKVFVPFYTTRKQGSGIGLSFSRQVMRLHRGTIRASSEPNVRTTFTLNF